MKTQILSTVLLLSQQCIVSIAARPLLRGHDNTDADADTDKLIDPKRDQHIIGAIGEFEATEDRYSYAVLLTDCIRHFCGGSLIAKDVVLTAAHCQGGSYNVVVGRHNIVNHNDRNVIRKKKEVPHPKYDSFSTDNDFMLVFLTRPATAYKVSLLKLNSRHSVPSVNQGVAVMGWGDTNIRDVLMHTMARVISNEECDESEGTENGYYDD